MPLRPSFLSFILFFYPSFPFTILLPLHLSQWSLLDAHLRSYAHLGLHISDTGLRSEIQTRNGRPQCADRTETPLVLHLSSFPFPSHHSVPSPFSNSAPSSLFCSPPPALAKCCSISACVYVWESSKEQGREREGAKPVCVSGVYEREAPGILRLEGSRVMRGGSSACGCMCQDSVFLLVFLS